MVWPGQALGYKIGALKIAELRQRAQTALGAKFSLPKFHEIAQGTGSSKARKARGQSRQTQSTGSKPTGIDPHAL